VITKLKKLGTYNQVMLELKFSLKDSLKVKQLQYILTEDVDYNIECLRVIEGVEI
jgi:hypothetical protein